jgi:hypothetical protein
MNEQLRMSMEIATKEILDIPNVKIFGGDRPDGRPLADAYDINCGYCEEWAAITRQKYFELTGQSVIEILSDIDLIGDFGEVPGHAFIRFEGKYYDAECPEGVDDWRKLPLFTRIPIK